MVNFDCYSRLDLINLFLTGTYAIQTSGKKLKENYLFSEFQIG